MKKYIVYDSTHQQVGITFNCLKDAIVYKEVYGNPNWEIHSTNVVSSRKSTNRQKAAIRFVEMWCDIEFPGNINDFYEVSDFLSDYLDSAKEIADDATHSYYSYLMDKD